MNSNHHDPRHDEDRHLCQGAKEAEICYHEQELRLLEEQQGADFPVWFYGVGAVPVLLRAQNHEHHE